MTKLSANLGFLWTELSLPDAIRAAAAAGFEAVECHWPYAVEPEDVKFALSESGLEMLGLNTDRGNLDAGENGLSALAGREVEARFAIDQAIEYAVAIGTKNIHVMAGFAEGAVAHSTLVTNLRYGLAKAEPHGITLLIEPLNHHDAPGYFLTDADQAAEIIAEIGSDSLKLMFDCYHLQIMQGDISRLLEKMMPISGHIQIAAVPSRAEPDEGELDYRNILKLIDNLGYKGFIGAEYKPRGSTDEGLGWVKAIV
ncbi:isomerase [Rhodobacterales bacterium 52_120_T64]|nr:isomerase [Rhodobacterales bacterium 52_120_T64]